MDSIRQNFEEIKRKIENEIIRDKMHSCCFTGYRPQKCPWGFNEKDPRCINMKKRVTKKIVEVINRGYDTFYTGMALGFDIICAEIILMLKKKYPHIRLIGALPCEDQDCLWTKEQQKRYRKILKKLDGKRCIYEEYIGPKCMIERNEFMINNSSICIALFDGKVGGTKSTLYFAQRQGVEVIIITLIEDVMYIS